MLIKTATRPNKTFKKLLKSEESCITKVSAPFYKKVVLESKIVKIPHISLVITVLFPKTWFKPSFFFFFDLC